MGNHAQAWTPGLWESPELQNAHFKGSFPGFFSKGCMLPQRGEREREHERERERASGSLPTKIRRGKCFLSSRQPGLNPPTGPVSPVFSQRRNWQRPGLLCLRTWGPQFQKPEVGRGPEDLRVAILYHRIKQCPLVHLLASRSA